MNTGSENPHKSLSQSHLHRYNLGSKVEDKKNFNFKNFENIKEKIDQQKEPNTIGNLKTSFLKLHQLKNNGNMVKEEMIDEITKRDLMLDINGEDFIEANQKNEQSLFYNEKDIEEDKELLDFFKIYSDFTNKSLNDSNIIHTKNISSHQPNNNASPSNLNNNNNYSKQQKNIFNFKKMVIEMIPEEDEERLKTENETGKKFYDNKQEKKLESLNDKLNENQVKKRLKIKSNPIKKNLETLLSNFQKEDSDNETINFIKLSSLDDKIKNCNNNENHNKKVKLTENLKIAKSKGEEINKNDVNSECKAMKINYNDILSINNVNGIHDLYPYNYSINIYQTGSFEIKDKSKCEFLKKSNSEIFLQEEESKINSYSKCKKPDLNINDNNANKINLYHSKSVNFDKIDLYFKLGGGKNINKHIVSNEKDYSNINKICNNYAESSKNKFMVDMKNVSANNKSNKNYKSVILETSNNNNNKNNNNSYPEIIKFDNNDKIDFENSFAQISEISIKNNSTLNSNYNMSPDKEKTLNESLLINQNSKEKLPENHLNHENNELKSLLDFIDKKQIQQKKSLVNNLKKRDEIKGNMSKNSSMNMNQNNTNSSSSAYSKKNAIINSKNIDSVDTDVSILNQHCDLNNKSKLSIKQIKDLKNKDNHLNLLKLSKIIINDETFNKKLNYSNKINVIQKKSNSNCSQNEIINNLANNNSTYANEKSNSSIFQSKIRVKFNISSQKKLNSLEKENTSSFNSNFHFLNINNKQNEKNLNKNNESQDVLNNNFDFNDFQSEEQDLKTLKFENKNGKFSDFDLMPIKFPIFTCESTKNKNNNTSLFNGNVNFDQANKEMKLPKINNSLNKSNNVNVDITENRHSFNSTKINNFNNSILKDKSFIRNLKNNSSVLSNKLEFNINSNYDEELIEPTEKDKFVSFRANNLMNLKSNLINFPNQKDAERNKMTLVPDKIIQNIIIEKNPLPEKDVHSNEGKTNFLYPITYKANTSNHNYNNTIHEEKKIDNNDSKVILIPNINANNKNSFILKKDNNNDKNRHPIKLFNLNLNREVNS